jgi:hypothetical protein
MPPRIPLLCHWRGDSDLAPAFLRHYATFCSEFHIILHGPPQESAGLIELSRHYPLKLRHHYDGDFDTDVKTGLLDRLARSFPGQWLLVVDSDELVEFPHDSLGETIAALEAEGASCLPAPLIQRIRLDGSLDTPALIADPDAEFPLCSPDLYRRMGSTGSTAKYPLLKVGPQTRLQAGNHHPPNGEGSESKRIRGTTHHFKWKRSVEPRIADRIRVGQNWAVTESVPYLRYLRAHDNHLPLEGSFPCSREELFRRGFLVA